MNRLIVVVMMVFGIIIGCSKPPEEGILGKWSPGDQLIMEFFKDGTVTGETSDGNILTGSYTWLDKTRMKVEFGGIYAINGPLIWEVSIDGDELKVTMNGRLGGTTFYQREKD